MKGESVKMDENERDDIGMTARRVEERTREVNIDIQMLKN